MDGIFISYRRDDSAGYAGRLYDRLAAHFGGDRVFMDVEGIEPGVDFVDAIERAVGSCRVLIVMIGDEWAGATDAAGRRRLDDPQDFVRLETAAALKRNIRVVPVLVGNATMPTAEQLPDALKPLTRRQAIEVMHKQWDASTGELIRTLERILQGDAAPPTPPKPPAPAARPSSRWTALGAAAVLVLASIAGVAWWLASRDDAGPSGAAPEAAAGKASDARVAIDATAGIAAIAANVPAASQPLPGASASGASAPARDVGVAAASSAPAATGPAQTPSPAPLPAPRPAAEPPSIVAFDAEPASASVRLCYHVRGAEAVSITPRPGPLAQRERDCVRVPVDAATRFTLLARNGAQTVQRTLAVTPAVVPGPATPPAVAAASTAPAREPPAAAAPRPAVKAPTTTEPRTPPLADSALPRVGESWVYRRSGKWRTSPRGSFTITVRAVSSAGVTDELRIGAAADGAAAEERRAPGAAAAFVSWSGIGLEFSPYLAAFGDPASIDGARGFATPDMGTPWRQWESRAEARGRDTVNVPAGRFDAFKVEVWSGRAASGSSASAHLEPVRIHHVIWYDRAVKRWVKMQRTVIAADNSVIDDDLFELVEHRF